MGARARVRETANQRFRNLIRQTSTEWIDDLVIHLHIVPTTQGQLRGLRCHHGGEPAREPLCTGQKSAAFKARSHAKLLKKASEQFRGKGVQGAAITMLMRKIGLAHGGFYAHFENKDAAW